MAYEIRRPEEEDEEKASAAAGPVAPLSGGGGGGVGAFGGGGSVGVGGVTAPTKAPGSKFVSFDRILSANRDAAERGANQLATTVGNNAEKASTDVWNTYDQFQTAVNNGTPKSKTDAPTTLTGVGAPPPSTLTGGAQPTAPSDGRGGTQIGGGPVGNARDAQTPIVLPSYDGTLGTNINGVSSVKDISDDKDPILTTEKPREVKSAEAMANWKYTGPENIRDFDGWLGLSKPIMAAVDDLNATGSEAGLGALNQKYFAPEYYTQGAKGMDASLFGAAGDDRFKQNRERYKNLDRLMTDREVGANDAVNRAKGTTELAASEAKEIVADYEKRKAEAQTDFDKREAERDSLKKKKTYEEYINPAFDEENHAYYVRNMTRADMISWLAKYFGHDGAHDKVTDWWEKQFEKFTGMKRNSRQITNNPNLGKVYPYITQEELEMLERMERKDADAWIENKIAELGLE